MTIHSHVWYRTVLSLAVLGLMAAMACGDGDGDSCENPPTSLGVKCGSCSGTYCLKTSSTCSDSNMGVPCLGTSSGMYCSKKCTSDADCDSCNIKMKCLKSCPDDPSLAGTCWASGSADWMASSVCPK